MEPLSIQMLGNFSVTWGGRKLPLGKNSFPKYVLLLQFLLLEGSGDRSGVTKSQLVKALYEDEEIANSNNSVNNLIYQLRRKMEKLGLPKDDYIVRSGEFYHMSPELPVRLDVNDFREGIAQAESAASDVEKEAAYRRAFDVYQGELLPMASTEIWVIVESVHLQSSYESCITWLGNYYKEKRDYKNLEYLYRRASKVDPYHNWELGWIDALVDCGNYRQAYQTYNEMARRYVEELGGTVTEEMLKCYDRIGERFQQFPDGADRIVEEIGKSGEGDFDGSGAYYCSYRSFVDACHIFRRNMERSGASIFLMVCTVMDEGDKGPQSAERLKKNGRLLRAAIGETLRRSDVYTQYSASQCLVLLTRTNQEDCQIVHDRLRQRLKQLGVGNIEIRYTAISLADI